MALRVDDAAQAIRHATDMLAKPFSGPIGRVELAIPAVRGVGDSLLYFLDGAGREATFVDVDFVADPDAQQGVGLGLLTIDHISQVVPQTEFQTWSLIYRSILGLVPEPRTDLNDPRGLIVSRALSNAERTPRLRLNASQAQASAAGCFMERTAGAGAQHIAFACTSIPVAAEPMGDGEFFHFFTRTINGLFFEVLQRRGYDRYGEANAPARLGAQAMLDRSPGEAITTLRQ